MAIPIIYLETRGHGPFISWHVYAPTLSEHRVVHKIWGWFLEISNNLTLYPISLGKKKNVFIVGFSWIPSLGTSFSISSLQRFMASTSPGTPFCSPPTILFVTVKCCHLVSASHSTRPPWLGMESITSWLSDSYLAEYNFMKKRGGVMLLAAWAHCKWRIKALARWTYLGRLPQHPQQQLCHSDHNWLDIWAPCSPGNFVPSLWAELPRRAQQKLHSRQSIYDFLKYVTGNINRPYEGIT